MTIPKPPDSGLRPRLKRWKGVRKLFRVHSDDYEPDSFNPGFGLGRFHPFQDSRGNSVPTLYASNKINGAFAETLFRNLVGGDILFERELVGKRLSRLEQAKDLVLVDLTGFSLKKIGLTRAELLDPDETYYHETALWARALYLAAPKAHGLYWVSRKFDTARSVVLFEDRLPKNAIRDLRLTEDLSRGRGLRRVKKAATLADITVAKG